MKKYILLAFFLFAVACQVVQAQQRAPRRPSQKAEAMAADSLPVEKQLFPKSETKIDTTHVDVPNIYAWKITPRLGERIFVPRDTVLYNFHQSSLVDGQGVAMGYLGNVGSPAQSKIFFDRPEPSRFNFLDAMYLWRKNPEDQEFLNTKIPYSNAKYQTGGGGKSAEQRLQTVLSMNLNKKLNVGFDFDYLYSRGYYNSLSNKQISYDFTASYIGDKYKMHAFFHNNNFTNIENGGIKDTLFITNPDLEQISQGYNYNGDTKVIPTRMENTKNKMRGRHFYVTNRYDLGNDMEQYAVNDTTMAWRKKENYVPLASAILTTHYTDQRRRITSDDGNLDGLYIPYNFNGEDVSGVKYMETINDFMSYYSFKNTFALAMNEGFRNWMKFGLTAFVEYDMRKYSIPGAIPGLRGRESEDALIVGGVLSKQKGKYLRYRATVEKDFLNSDFKAEGEVSTMLNLFGKQVSAKANAYIKNISPNFFQNNFSTKYWNWSNLGLDDTRRVYVGGEIVFPEFSFSSTKISGGVENIQNYIYYGANRLIAQHSGSVQVVALRLDQNFKAGIFHWDNQLVFQKTSKDEVIPLPTISAYSNIYLQTKIAKVLTVQLGGDVRYHSKYYMSGYEPLTMQFYNQDEMKLGGFPLVTAYANLHLKYTRFFIMYYNALNGMGNAESFSLFRYPVNPSILKMGISWQFNN
ncbi:putative porin [Dysgonomonas sp. 511]|uniref:putative porin n=1 Tax=Dysgonomonas sp. 511 TaxID=2302930 RepID=UPI0013D35F1C|nr:putative porin [Dysgonomonas sp. 511]NDV79118.1 hypothetical protein [Dysgonomonas sp. 511]